MPQGMLRDTGWWRWRRKKRTLNLMLSILGCLLMLILTVDGQNCSFDPAKESLECQFQSSSAIVSRNSSRSLASASRAERIQFQCQDAGASPAMGSQLREGHFGHLPQLRDLEIVGCQIDKVPSGAFEGLSSLTSLAVAREGSYSSMVLDKESFSGLNDLRTLNLSGNELWTLPDGVLCSLNSLSILNMSRNNLQDASEMGFGMTEVESCQLPTEVIDLSNNQLSRLASGVFGQLRKLRRLDLSSNSLNVVDDDALAGITNLEVLDMSGNSLVALPPDLFGSEDDGTMCCEQLSELHLQNNSLTGLAPGLLHNLGQLLVLNLSRNDIGNDWLDADAFASLTRLVALDLSYNRLTSLPRGLFGSLSSLQLLDLSHNNLRVVPGRPFLAMHNLHILKLSHNSISDLQEDALEGLSGLGSLALDHNKLDSLRSGVLSKCSGLADLELQHNAFTTLPSVALKELASLRTLDIGDNRISSVNEASFEGLRTVYALKLSNNGIKDLKTSYFAPLSNLKVLNLAHNRISELEQGVFKELSQLRMLRLDNNTLGDINGILAGQTSLRWLNVSSNALQWFDYAFIPKSLRWLDIGDNSIEELGNYYKMKDDGYKLSTLLASKNSIKKLEGLSLLHSIEELDVSENKVKSITPSTFEGKPNLVKVNLAQNLLRRLHLPNNLITNKGVPPEFMLAGNPFFCNCEMDWLLKSASGSSNNNARIADLEGVNCRTADRFNGNSSVRSAIVRPVKDMRPEEFLCQYQAHCFALCNCCDFFACDCRMQCPRGCSCYHDSTWSTNVIQCSRRGHSSIPPLIPMDATAIYMDGNNLTGVLESQAFIGRKRVHELYLNGSGIEAISNQTFNGLTELQVLHLEDNKIQQLTGHEFQNLTSLRKLFLTHNLLSHISKSAFTALVSLEELHLEHNGLTNYPVWDMATLPSLTKLHLSANPWSCDCDFVTSFKDFAASSSIVVDLDMCQCQSGDSGSKVNLSENVTCSDAMAVTYLEAESINSGSNSATIIVMVIVVSLSLLIVILALILALVFRTPARIWLHSKYGMRVLNGGGGSHDRLYDAFVSYSAKDDNFVQQILLPRLEHEEPGYKLCLQHRDVPRNGSLEEVFPGMARLSARQIIILSKPYLESEWSQIRFAIQDTKKLKLIVVVLEELTSLDMATAPELTSVLKSCQSVRWSEAGFWNKLRFHLPDPKFRTSPARSRTLNMPGASLGGTAKLLQQQQQQQQQQQSTAPRYASSRWNYESVLGEHSSSSGSAASPRTLTGGSSNSSSSSTDNRQQPQHQTIGNIRANPLANWQPQQPQQHHTYHTIQDGGNNGMEPIYHTLEPSISSSAPSPAPPPINLDQFDTLGRLDVMLPNGQFVPATLVRNHNSGRLVPLVEVDDTSNLGQVRNSSSNNTPSRSSSRRGNNNNINSSSSKQRRFL